MKSCTHKLVYVYPSDKRDQLTYTDMAIFRTGGVAEHLPLERELNPNPNPNPKSPLKET